MSEDQAVSPHTPPNIAPLAWVIGEIRTSLAQASDSLEAFLGHKQDLDRLRQAREQVHQANGALQLLDLRGVALVGDAVEQTLRRFEHDPAHCLPGAVRVIERALQAVIAYLEGLLAGRANQPLLLFPYYRDVLELVPGARVHPADLVFPDLTRRPPFHRMQALQLTPDELRVRRARFESGLLGFLRDMDDRGPRRQMLESLAELELIPQRGLARSFWWVTHGLLEALAQGSLTVDVDLKRLLARLNLQLRRMIEGSGAVAERLMVDTLYFVGRANRQLPRVAEIAELYALDALIPADFEHAQLTPLDTRAAEQLREALAAAKATWSAVAEGGGDLAAFQHEVKLAEAAALRLEAAPLIEVISAIQEAGSAWPGLAAPVRGTLALELAQALLFVELGAEGLPQIDPAYLPRATAMSTRLQAAARGEPLPDTLPWLSELARRAQDRSALASLIAETQSTLHEIEQRLDAFFREPQQRGELAGVDARFDQMAGVLAVLGHEQPATALREAQAEVRRWADPAAALVAEDFSRVAHNLGAVGFFIEGLRSGGEQPVASFRFDAATGLYATELTPLADAADEADEADERALAAPVVALPLPPAAEPARVGAGADNVEAQARANRETAHRHAARLLEAPGDARALEELARLLPLLAQEAEILDDGTLKSTAQRAQPLVARLRDGASQDCAVELEALLAPPRPQEAPPPSAPLPSTQAAADLELLGIFVEEAREVLDSIDEQLAEMRRHPSDKVTITNARRAFHTLKGSSRMVGLKQFGEGAWAVEQCFNLWLAQERPASEDLIQLAAGARSLIGGWVDAIERDPAATLDFEPLVVAANRVREGGAFRIEEATATVPAAAPATEPPAPAAAEAHAPEELGADVEVPDINFDDLDAAVDAALSTPALVEEALEEPAAAEERREDVRRIGPLEISHGLYTIFLSEADECARVLAQDFAEWRHEPARTVSALATRRAHSLAGITATVGLAPVLAIADPLDDLLHELSTLGPTRHYELVPAQFDMLDHALERMNAMLHAFAGGRYPDEAPLEAGAVADLLAIVRAYAALHEELVDTAEPEPGLASEGVLAEHMGASNATPETLAAPEALGDFELAAPAPIDEQVLEQVDEALALAEESPAPVAPAVELTDAEAYEPLADFRAAEAAIAHLGEPEVSEATTAEHGAGLVEAMPDALETAAANEPAAGALESVVAEAGLAPELVAAIARDEPESTVADELDAELLEVFLVEGNEQLPAIGAALRVLAESPDDREAARDLMRRLHTVKGSARMAGAMRLGELVHAMETRIENAAQTGRVPQPIVEALHAQYDRAVALFDGLQAPAAAPESAAAPASATQPAMAPVIELPRAPGAPAAAVASFIRVRADVLDRLVDQAGEVAIARSKLENEVGTMRSSLADLTDNISRLRAQLREVSIQAEAQITARGDSLSRESDKFDPLEFDRFTRLQELTRLLTESVEDVALVHGNMLKGLQMAEQDLTSQSRLTRELQQQLMRVRLVPFSNVSERLYRVARQAAKELDKRVHLEIRGAATEIDRGVLERMAGPFEHLVRNAIVHGIESPAARARAGKAETGELRIDVRQEGNEIVVNFGDDGAGLPLERIRARAEARGLVAPGQVLSERELMELIFAPGFSTADEITELAGRGVGMDVVRSELSGFGGRVTVNTEPGRGTRFTLYLPLTLAVTQVVLATVGERRYAIPAAMVEQVRRMRPMVMEQALAEGVIDLPPAGQVVLRPLAQLADEPLAPLPHKPIPVVLVRSGDDRLAIMVDEVSSNQEVVVKAVGAQVARLAGILGATILGSGEIVLILNPVQMITRAPEPAAIFEAKAPSAPTVAEPVERGVPTVMVVDDSITVRRVTQRLLERQGWEVLLAKDGVDALRQLQDAKPDVMLVDIEMPRMDGFDLTRNLRGSRATANIPIIMITSRTADKHRSMAFDLGVNEYLGKPYQEDELVALIKRYTAERLPA